LCIYFLYHKYNSEIKKETLLAVL